MTLSLYQQALNTPWAIEQSWIPIILSAADGKGDIELADKKKEAYALQMIDGKPLDGSYSTVIRDGVAIISVVGPIIPRASLFSRISAISSTEQIAQDIKRAMTASNVHSIILYMDTPGGAAKFINELSDYIYSLRTSYKPIKTYVAGSCNSGGYWMGSSTSEIIIDATADLGSIGVVMAGEKINPKPGTVRWEIVSSRAPKKRLDPTTTDGAEDYLRIIDSLEDVFYQSLVRNMNVSIETIANDFGQGSVLVGEYAIAKGMAHRIGSLEGLIDEFITKRNPHNRGNTMDKKDNAAQAGEITKVYIEQNHPDIAAAFKKEGVESVDTKAIEEKAITVERERITKITSLQRKGFESQVQAGIDEGMTPEAVSMNILTAMNDRGISHDDMQGDSPDADTSNVESFAGQAEKENQAKNGDWDAAAKKSGIKIN